jgi:hypothetical protein
MKKGLVFDERKMFPEQTMGKLIINFVNRNLFFFFCCILQPYESVEAAMQGDVKPSGNFIFSF